MRLSTRLRKLEAVVPRCDEPILRFVGPGEEYVPTDADRCRVCGGSHVQIVQEVIVRTRAEAERVLALNAAGGRP